ncbi:Uncharacterized protein Adt_21857 [Abeliophyllum distichum]|uniref:Uncharacterized protein n=1 Tax=Abeliophyllum distichum TaxID=126358 RepID=A0ABD1T0I9_9LAMI
MKPEYLILTLLMPSFEVPGKYIDILLRPLVDELKELWADRIDMRDAKTNNRSVFRMCAALLWIVNDFSMRSSLFGWSGQGYMACPMCNKKTLSVRVIEFKHNIDVMHVEKNVCDSLLGTILDDIFKSKNTVRDQKKITLISEQE